MIIYGSKHKNIEDKENRRYAKLEDRNVRTYIHLGIKIWRIKRTEDNV